MMGIYFQKKLDDYTRASTFLEKNNLGNIDIDEWFERANTKKCFKKYNEEIVVNEFVSNEGITTVDKEFMSIILQCENENESVALEEFRFIKDQLILGKN